MSEWFNVAALFIMFREALEAGRRGGRGWELLSLSHKKVCLYKLSAEMGST